MARSHPFWRHIFNTLTVVSLLLMLGTVGLEQSKGTQKIKGDADAALFESGLDSSR